MWLAGFTKCQPIAMNTITIATFTATIIALTVADSSVPFTSSAVRISRITIAGMFRMPPSNGEWQRANGNRASAHLLQ